MGIRLVVLDFDGTCTDIEAEGAPFLEAYRRDLAGLLGTPDVDGPWAEAVAAIHADPARHGMRLGGHLVAPPVDPYLLAGCISGLLVPDGGDALTERLFRENYRYTRTVFKEGAREALEALVGEVEHLRVVSNSDTARVAGKLDRLAPRGRERIGVRGNARKYLVADPVVHAGHPRFDRVPAEMAVPGWGRPVLPRRGHYFDVLQAVWRETGTSPEETLVVGDVFDLDLALPGHLGAQVHLVPSPRSLPYETRATEALGGRADPDLAAVLERLAAAR